MMPFSWNHFKCPTDGYLMTIITVLNSALLNLTEVYQEEPKF